MMNDKPRYAVIGNPVAHSRSPEIHRQFAAQEYVEIEYIRICAEIGGFAQAAERFFAEGGQGRMLPFPSKPMLSTGWTNIPNARRQPEWSILLSLWAAAGFSATTPTARVWSAIWCGRAFLRRGSISCCWARAGRYAACSPRCWTNVRQALPSPTARLKKHARWQGGSAFRTALMQDLTAGYFDVVINGTSCGLSGQLPDIASAVFGKCGLAYDMVLWKGGETVFGFSPAGAVRRKRPTGWECWSDRPQFPTGFGADSNRTPYP